MTFYLIYVNVLLSYRLMTFLCLTAFNYIAPVKESIINEKYNRTSLLTSYYVGIAYMIIIREGSTCYLCTLQRLGYPNNVRPVRHSRFVAVDLYNVSWVLIRVFLLMAIHYNKRKETCYFHCVN